MYCLHRPRCCLRLLSLGKFVFVLFEQERELQRRQRQEEEDSSFVVALCSHSQDQVRARILHTAFSCPLLCFPAACLLYRLTSHLSLLISRVSSTSCGGSGEQQRSE